MSFWSLQLFSNKQTEQFEKRLKIQIEKAIAKTEIRGEDVEM